MHPFSPPRFLHKYERQLSILIVGTLRWKIAGSKREAFRQERGFADVSHKSLTFDLKSVPPFKKRTLTEEEEEFHPLFHPLALDTRRVVSGSPSITVHEPPRSNTRFISPHSSRKRTLIIIPLLIPRAGHLFLFPSFHATRQRHGWDQPLFSSIATFRSSNRRNRRIRWVALAPLVLLFEKGEGGKVVFSRLGKETLTRVKKRRDENEKAHV